MKSEGRRFKNDTNGNKKELWKQLMALKKEIALNEIKVSAEMKEELFLEKSIVALKAKIEALVEAKADNKTIAELVLILTAENDKDHQIKVNISIEESAIKEEMVEAKKIWAEIKGNKTERPIVLAVNEENEMTHLHWNNTNNTYPHHHGNHTNGTCPHHHGNHTNGTNPHHNHTNGTCPHHHDHKHHREHHGHHDHHRKHHGHHEHYPKHHHRHHRHHEAGNKGRHEDERNAELFESGFAHQNGGNDQRNHKCPHHNDHHGKHHCCPVPIILAALFAAHVYLLHKFRASLHQLDDANAAPAPVAQANQVDEE